MTYWKELFGRGSETLAAGVLLLVLIAIWQPREYSCAPTDPEGEGL